MNIEDIKRAKEEAEKFITLVDACYNQMKKEVDGKDKEIASLIAKLERERDILNRIFDMAKRNNGVLYFRQDDGIWKIETGKDTDAPANPSDNAKE